MNADYEVRPTSNGHHGVFALRSFKAGEIISAIHWGDPGPVRSRWTIQCAEGVHAMPLPENLKYVNHSCAPSVFFDIEKMQLAALTEIAVGQELTFFYPSTEWEMTESFQCSCGAAQCLGTISGAVALTDEQRKRYRLSPVVQKQIARQRAAAAS